MLKNSLKCLIWMVFPKDFIHRIKERVGAKLHDAINLLVKGGIPLSKIKTIFINNKPFGLYPKETAD